MNYDTILYKPLYITALYFSSAKRIGAPQALSGSIIPEQKSKNGQLLKSCTPSRDTPVMIYSPKQTEKMLNISHSMLYKIIRNGELHTFTIGRKRCITKEAIEDYIAECNSRSSNYGF